MTKEAHDFKTNSNVYFALLIFSKTEQLRELAGVFPLPKASLLLVLGRTKLYCIYTWRRELVISVVPPFKLSVLAAPKQNLELGMGKGVPARERAGTKYWCLFFTVVFFSSDSAVVRMEHSSVDSRRLSLA